MRRWRCSEPRRDVPAARRIRWRSDDGSAAVEYLAAGVLLLVPLVYLVLVVSAVHSAALATEGAARQAARVYARAADDVAGERGIERSVAVALRDYGVDPRGVVVEKACAPDPGNCLIRGGTVTVSVRAEVALPLMPTVLDVRTPASVPVFAAATQPVSRFRVGGGAG